MCTDNRGMHVCIHLNCTVLSKSERTLGEHEKICPWQAQVKNGKIVTHIPFNNMRSGWPQRKYFELVLLGVKSEREYIVENLIASGGTQYCMIKPEHLDMPDLNDNVCIGNTVLR